MHKTANHTDMFHDLRARDFEEAILWHFGESEITPVKCSAISPPKSAAS